MKCTKGHRYHLAVCPVCKLEEKDKRNAELEEALNDQVERTLALDDKLQFWRRVVIRLTEERDVFKRTLDKRDEQLGHMTVRAETLEDALQRLQRRIQFLTEST